MLSNSSSVLTKYQEIYQITEN